MLLRWSLAALLTLLFSCSKGVHNKDAIRQGVIDHLSSRKGLDLDLTAMDVEVTGVNFRASEADATVSFRPKGASGAGMEMKYTLERKGDQWAVKSKAEAGGSPHAAPDPHGGMGSGGGVGLPPGHPPMTAPSPAENK